MYRYAIIDSAQRVGFHQRLDKYGVDYRSLYEGHAEGNLPEIAPLLVSFSESTDSHRVRAQADIQKLAQERPAVSIIETTLTTDELAKHLRRFHTVQLPEQKAMILRWYDTRILPVWMETMSEAQRAGFAEGITRWTAYDRFGDEIELPLPAERPAFASLPPYELDQPQYDRLLDACLPDVLIAQLRNVIKDELKQIPERVLYPFVVEHLQASRAHGLDNLDDHTQYLLLALYTSGRFVEHPQVHVRLSKPCSEHEQPFAEWVDSLPPEVYEPENSLWRTSSDDRDRAA